jgi:hypothetical protein
MAIGGIIHSTRGDGSLSDTLEQMRRNPQANWTIRDVKRLCRQFGVDCEPPRAGGSHYKVCHASQKEILTIPFRRPIKPVYIRKFVEFIDAVGSLDERS